MVGDASRGGLWATDRALGVLFTSPPSPERLVGIETADKGHN